MNYQLEKENIQKKLNENTKISDLKQQLSVTAEDKRNLIINQRELTTQASILRSEIALLKVNFHHFYISLLKLLINLMKIKAQANEKDNDHARENCYKKESSGLKNEINMLQETNKKLNDTNDLLLNEINGLSKKKALTNKLVDENDLTETFLSSSTPSYPNLRQKPFRNRPIFLSCDRVTDDDSIDLTDEEIGRKINLIFKQMCLKKLDFLNFCRQCQLDI